MTAAEIQQEIERTRQRLGETVEELAAKADVKARVRGKAADVRAKAQDKATELSGKAQDKAAELSGQAAELSGRAAKSQVVRRRWPLAVAAGALVAGSAIVIWRRRKT
jgi:succinyl-CoA synthetase beta subunit